MGIVEVRNRLLQKILKKIAPKEWNEKLVQTTQQINVRVI